MVRTYDSHSYNRGSIPRGGTNRLCGRFCYNTHMSIPQLFIILIAILNLVSFILVYIDKQKSLAHSERLPEVDFFVWAIFFSSLGVLVGMFAFRHKTKKLNFIFGIGLLLLQQIVLTYLILDKIHTLP